MTKKFILMTILLTLSSQAFAQKIKVRRVKGNQAVVEFSGGSLQQGQAYELVQDEFSEGSSSASHRRYLVNLNFSLENTKSDASGAQNETDLSLSGRFGWNFGQFEFGPMLSYSSDMTGSITLNTLIAGGFADFNLIPNAPGEIFIYGIGGTAGAGQREGSGSTISLMSFTVMPFVKWFPTGGDLGFRIDAGYAYQKLGASGGDVTVTGIVATAGIIGYF